MTSVQPGIFWGKGGFLEEGTSISVSCTACNRKAPHGKILVVFLQDTFKTAS